MGVTDYRTAGFLAVLVGVCAAECALSPKLQRCVLMLSANITCFWEPAQETPPGTSYTLQVNEMRDLNGSVFAAEDCRTEQNHCHVRVLTMSAFYCISVTAHSALGNASSAQLCLHGTTIVKLYAPVFSRFSGVPEWPYCLQIQWIRPSPFGLPNREVSAGFLDYQLEYTTEDRTQVVSVDLRDRQTVLCLFRPFTLYTARMRWRYHRTPYWSDWSSVQQARTEEAAPSVAPQVWRWVEPAGGGGWRRVTLLWKPLALCAANGVVLGYSVSCWEEGGPVETNPGDCGGLRSWNASCRLSLPPRRCSCAVSAFNSAGSSPAALIAIPAARDTVAPPPQAVNVTPLDDHSLDVRWTAPCGQSASGFVVTWCAMSETAPCSPHWLRLNESAREAVITEGVEPEVRYAVSVSALHGQDVGAELAVQTYSREGAPSAGPSLHVTELGSSSVALQWEPLPLEQRRGFIQNYALYWQSTGGHAKRIVVPREQLRYTLTGLSGEYQIYLVANTNSGATAGRAIGVDVGRGSLPVWTILCCSTLTLLTLLVALSCLKHRDRVRKYLYPKVPDPARSSILWGDVKSLHAPDCLKPPRPALETVSQVKGDWQHPLVVTPILWCGLEGFDLAEGGYLTVPAPPTPSSAQSQSSVGATAHPHSVTNFSYWASDRKDLPDCSYASLCVVDPVLPRPATAPGDKHEGPFRSQDGLPLLRDHDTFPLLPQLLWQGSDPPPRVTDGSWLPYV